jgi:hypothetical protein
MQLQLSRRLLEMVRGDLDDGLRTEEVVADGLVAGVLGHSRSRSNRVCRDQRGKERCP